MPALTTTSYAILGLLSLRPWSAYELARQMERSLRFFWPRAESKLYEEPKNLVAHGLASVERTHRGRRPRTVYTITPAGRRALEEWLARPGAGPLLEFEGLLKVFFASPADREQLLATLQAIRAQAEANRRRGAALAQAYLDGAAPFPERLAVNVLVFRFLWDYTAMLAGWLAWAEGVVRAWPEGGAPQEEALEVIRQALASLSGDPTAGAG